MRVLVSLLLLAVATVPSAAADATVCEPEDVLAVRYTFDGARNGTTLADARAGERVHAVVEAKPECVGRAFTLVSFARSGDLVATHAAGWDRAEAHDGKARVEVETTLPACTYRLQLIVGRVGDGVVVESAEGGETPCPRLDPPPCPQDVVARSERGVVRLARTSVEGASAYEVHRAVEEGNMTLHATVTSGAAFEDADVELQRVYHYAVVAVNDGGSAQGCAVATVTAVPLFGGPLVVAIALAGSVAAYALARRR